MKASGLEKYLNNFGDKVVKGAEKELRSSKDSQGKSRGDTALGKSIRVKVKITPTGFSTKFYMADYGTFLDKGVKGTKSNYIENSKTDYSYKNKQPPSGIIEKWIKKKGIKGRNKKSGRFITNKSLAFLIGRSIKEKGIKSLSFFQKPLGIEYNKLRKGILEVLKLDIQTYITTFTK